VNLAAKSCFIAPREMLPESFRTTTALGRRRRSLQGFHLQKRATHQNPLELYHSFGERKGEVLTGFPCSEKGHSSESVRTTTALGRGRKMFLQGFHLQKRATHQLTEFHFLQVFRMVEALSTFLVLGSLYV
jgi:hypothetical protein